MLHFITRTTGAKVVCMGKCCGRSLRRLLEQMGIEYMGETTKCGTDSNHLRPFEILGWLHAWNVVQARSAVTQYVVIDDCELQWAVGGDELEGG